MRGIILQRLLQSWVSELVSKDHLTSLLENNSLTIHFTISDECAVIAINNGMVKWLEKTDQEIDVYIECDRDVLTSLLSGEIKLREAWKNNCIQLQATFRATLYLETLFKLSSISIQQLEVVSKI